MLTNNYGFEVERLQDSKIARLQDWEKVGFVTGFGTTSESKSYSFTDKNLSEGKYIYRLNQIDFDGSFEYSNEIKVEVSLINKFVLEQNFPNPFNPSTTIKYQIPKDGIVTLKIFDILGKEVKTLVNEMKVTGGHEIIFDAGELASGFYIYRIQVNNYIAAKKMMLLK